MDTDTFPQAQFNARLPILLTSAFIWNQCCFCILCFGRFGARRVHRLSVCGRIVYIPIFTHTGQQSALTGICLQGKLVNHMTSDSDVALTFQPHVFFETVNSLQRSIFWKGTGEPTVQFSVPLAIFLLSLFNFTHTFPSNDWFQLRLPGSVAPSMTGTLLGSGDDATCPCPLSWHVLPLDSEPP